jgi:hypothetical protein
MKENFAREIEHLLDAVPADQWADWSVCGVLYDFIPWHRSSCLTLQTREDREGDIAAWKYYWSAESDGSRIQAEFAEYEQGRGWQTYHKLLIEAAEAFVSIDFSRFGRGQTVDDGRLFGPFRLQVYDPDGSFRFNFCEFVLARRLYPLR